MGNFCHFSFPTLQKSLITDPTVLAALPFQLMIESECRAPFNALGVFQKILELELLHEGPHCCLIPTVLL